MQALHSTNTRSPTVSNDWSIPGIPLDLHEITLFVREANFPLLEESCFFTVFLQPDAYLSVMLSDSMSCGDDLLDVIDSRLKHD